MLVIQKSYFSKTKKLKKLSLKSVRPKSPSISGAQIKDQLDFEKKYMNIPMFECGRCEFIFDAKNNLQDHYLDFHLEEIVFGCSIPSCEYSSKDVEELHNHIYRKHIWEAQNLKCPGCRRSFPSDFHVENHFVDTHVSEIDSNINKTTKYGLFREPFECELDDVEDSTYSCNFASRTNYELGFHRFMVHNSPPFKMKYRCHVSNHSGKKNCKHFLTKTDTLGVDMIKHIVNNHMKPIMMSQLDIDEKMVKQEKKTKKFLKDKKYMEKRKKGKVVREEDEDVTKTAWYPFFLQKGYKFHWHHVLNRIGRFY